MIDPHHFFVVLVLLLKVEWVEHVAQVKTRFRFSISNFLLLVCGLFFAAAAKQLSLSNRKGKPIESFSDAFESGIQSVESYARVQPGDKSLLDALIPAVDFIKSKLRQENFTAQDWKELAMVTEEAAQETKNFTAKVGRAAYTKAIDNYVADPGAYAVAIIFQAVSDTFVKAKTR